MTFTASVATEASKLLLFTGEPKTCGQFNLCPAGHRLESTVRYLGIEVEDALEISEQTEI